MSRTPEGTWFPAHEKLGGGQKKSNEACNTHDIIGIWWQLPRLFHQLRSWLGFISSGVIKDAHYDASRSTSYKRNGRGSCIFPSVFGKWNRFFLLVGPLPRTHTSDTTKRSGHSNPARTTHVCHNERVYVWRKSTIYLRYTDTRNVLETYKSSGQKSEILSQRNTKS